MSVEEKFEMSKKEDHEQFIEMMRYLNQYKENICYDSQGIVAMIKHMGQPKDEVEAEEMDELLEAYSSQNLFPRETEGPKAGKLIPWKDIRGNVVVDPTANIKQAPFIIDYNAYKKYKALQNSSGLSAK